MARFPVRIVKSWILWAAIVLVAAGAYLYMRAQTQKRLQQFITHTVKRGDLVISVAEGGNLIALRSQKIVNEVFGQRTILEVVDEGIHINDDDVKKGRVLVRLDSKDLDDRVQQQQITVENSQASLTEAQENLTIQKKQNESDIRQAELRIRFCLIDLEKYLGKGVARKVIEKPEGGYAALMKNPDLGGEALNRRRQLENSIDLAREEVARAKDKVDWSARLSEKGYITKSEMEADNLSRQQKEANLEQAKLEYELFVAYDFPKQVEKLYSDYQEALSDMDRTRSKCQARLIQAETNVKSRRATYMLNQSQLDEFNRNIAKCTIRATQPGFVVYPGSDRPWRSDNPIQPGTTVRQFQELLSLPDFNSMGVETKIHESAVERISVGQPATIRVDAFPQYSFTGKVVKVALMPDPTLKWMNPDVNVYVAQIALDNSYDFLKPGMSAKVEIFIKKIEKALTVPLLALSFPGGKPSCTILFRSGRTETRPVVLGESTEEYAEIRSGLGEGEVVAIRPGRITQEVKNKPSAERGSFESAPAAGGQAAPAVKETAPAVGQPAPGAAAPPAAVGGGGDPAGRSGGGGRRGPRGQGAAPQP